MTSPEALAVIRTESIAGSFTALIQNDPASAPLLDGLRSYLVRSRWFAGKSRSIAGLSIADAEAQDRTLDDGAVVRLMLWEVQFSEGAPEWYSLPLGIIDGDHSSEDDGIRSGSIPESARIARLEEPTGRSAWLFDASASGPLWDALLRAIDTEDVIELTNGRIESIRTNALVSRRPEGGDWPKARTASLEQSNSAVLYGDRFFLKAFRKLERGVNLDWEIGRFLTEQARFDHCPATLGGLSYLDKASDEPITLAILQGQVVHRGSGWDYALDQVGAYYRAVEACQTSAPDLTMALGVDEASTAPIREALASWTSTVRLLGRRTAEMHRALAADPDDPAFRPEPLSIVDIESVASGVATQVDDAVSALMARSSMMPEFERGLAERVIASAPNMMTQLDALATGTTTSNEAVKIRTHGDYHLGQVLWTGGDVIILDFEGEPARRLAERRAKKPAVRDVVGMVRSFGYAAYAGLFAVADGRSDLLDALAPWARFWEERTVRAYLDAYDEAIAGQGPTGLAIPIDSPLGRAYLLEKAFYELLYELNNRPTWVRIPLQSIVEV